MFYSFVLCLSFVSLVVSLEISLYPFSVLDLLYLPPFLQLQMHRKKLFKNLFLSINYFVLISLLFCFLSLTFISLFIHYYSIIFSLFFHFSRLSHVNNSLCHYLSLRFPLSFFFPYFSLVFSNFSSSLNLLCFPVLFFCFLS